MRGNREGNLLERRKTQARIETTSPRQGGRTKTKQQETTKYNHDLSYRCMPPVQEHRGRRPTPEESNIGQLQDIET
ncbi:hypothetical protein BOTBODRAFT_33013 [Botryobasidium botryosum FD-172 SS1]|uniref:Uncharacterized protein n=1 Tax=Botryobasidium botryosum (strain FD-172 SS1) TaxID=930990 RepID=A0A067MEM4_BOTB1|nr:hypothetical protein BOTBODRAFT_33013 [Botryobasidium botryosum FD-172 SS1]